MSRDKLRFKMGPLNDKLLVQRPLSFQFKRSVVRERSRRFVSCSLLADEFSFDDVIFSMNISVRELC